MTDIALTPPSHVRASLSTYQLVALLLVAQRRVDHREEADGTRIWSLGSTGAVDSSISADLWWLWEAGLIEFRPGGPLVILTDTGRQHVTQFADAYKPRS